MYQIQIQIRCTHCLGKAYIDPYEVVEEGGSRHTRYRACAHCQGRGSLTRWVSLSTFMQLVRQEQALTQLEGAKHE